MQHSFKFIYVIAIVVIIMIVVTLGLFVMKQTQGFVTSVDLSKTQINDFNAIWTGYERLQKGSTLKGMFQKLAKNAEENSKNPQMLIDVAYNITDGSEFQFINSTVKNPNSEAFEEVINKLVLQHAYTVELIYNDDTGIVTGIIVKSARTDKVEFVPDEK